jgi:uncharacterized protein YutE (UPF0331/DUF86 family)
MSIDTERVNRFLLEIKNSLIHRYWVISDSKLLCLVRENSRDFEAFIQAIQAYVANRVG